MVTMIDNTHIDRLVETVARGPEAVAVSGTSGAFDAYLTARLAERTANPVVVVTAGLQEAERICADTGFFMDAGRPAPVLFPTYSILPFKPVAYHNWTAAARVDLLYRMTQAETPPVIVLPVEGLLQRLIPKKALCDYADILMAGESVDLAELKEKLQAGGYSHAAIVEEPGDFCVRGGVIDIFSPFHEDPVRIELFGDLVETLSFFSPVSQRRHTNISEMILLPARETVLEQSQQGRLIASVKKQAALLDLPLAESRSVIDRLKTENDVTGLESLLPLMYDRLATFFDYLPEQATFVLLSPDSLKEAAETHQQQAADNYEETRQAGKMCVSPESLYLTWTDIRTALCDYPEVAITLVPPRETTDRCGRPITALDAGFRSHSGMQARLAAQRNKENPLAPLAEWVKDHQEKGRTVVIVCGSDAQAERMAELLRHYRIHLQKTEDLPSFPAGDQRVYTKVGQLSGGFEAGREQICVISDVEIFGRQYRRKKPEKKRSRRRLLELEDLKKKDLVVHEDYGIGQYQGIANIAVEGIRNDFLLITYKDEDRLYLSVDRMDMVKKYIGVEGIEPVLDKMGAKSWEQAKKKAGREVEKMANDLLKLYAKRRVNPKNAFSRPDSLYRKFEEDFPYEETGDQLEVVEEVLSDMTADMPMDRLVCGDVGYGKTEIAMRASFVAVSDGRQVAVLVPTTVLAEQHMETFSRRFADYPVNIACLNRFRSRAEQKKIVENVKAGRVDIVIGTHRLLSNDIGFSDLGLLVLDEEQRFGVKHKEVLKKMRSTVDVLSLTATPIPRTLHMSLLGVRDISTINTPPENRMAIKTYVCEFDDTVVAAAIRRELARGGQIYFVHNNINKIDAIASRLQRLVPEVRLGVAHGRLKKDELEREMFRFINREIDMLVCTRIIESGLDIPAANTIFVNRADKFGLAQIYQLRGRVGRAGEQAYAYLFIPNESALGRDARKRLKVLMEHSDLGSGFQIAMNDLQIRGGGSVLGASQSGHIAAVGYDMFLQLMERTMAELKGEAVETPLQPEVNIPVSTHIEEDYIPAIDQRLAVYRRLSRAKNASEINEIKEELIDRYGPLPQETENLLLKILLKTLAAEAGVKKLDLSNTELRLQFSLSHFDHPHLLEEIAADHGGSYSTEPQPRLTVSFDAKKERASVVAAKKILKAIIRRATNK